MKLGHNLYEDAENFLKENFNLDRNILEPYLVPDYEIGELNLNQIYDSCTIIQEQMFPSAPTENLNNKILILKPAGKDQLE